MTDDGNQGEEYGDEEWGEEEEEWEAANEEEEEILRALDWLDLVDDGQGGGVIATSTSSSGLNAAARRPNKQKTDVHAAKKTMQPRAAQQAGRFQSLINLGTLFLILLLHTLSSCRACVCVMHVSLSLSLYDCYQWRNSYALRLVLSLSLCLCVCVYRSDERTASSRE